MDGCDAHDDVGMTPETMIAEEGVRLPLPGIVKVNERYGDISTIAKALDGREELNGGSTLLPFILSAEFVVFVV
jgi:hypothetical protein